MRPGMDPRSIGSPLHEVRGNAHRFKLVVDRHRHSTLFVMLYQVHRGQRGPYEVHEQIDRWWADDPAGARVTRDSVQEILAESVLQRRIPGID